MKTGLANSRISAAFGACYVSCYAYAPPIIIRMTPKNATISTRMFEQTSYSRRIQAAKTVVRRGAVWLTMAVWVSVKNLTLVKLMQTLMLAYITLTISGPTLLRFTESQTVFFKFRLTTSIMIMVVNSER